MKKKIWVAILNEGNVRQELSRVITNLQTQSAYDVHIDQPSDRPISNSRNKIVQRFLAHKEFDYLLMIDDDIVPLPTILNLADYQKDIIGALCFMYQQNKVLPVAFKRNRDGLYNPIIAKDREGLLEVDAVGTGCVMLSRKVLEAVKAPFLNEYDPDGIKTYGLDINFCQKARKKGFKVFVHLDYPCDHWQTMNLRRVYAVNMAYIDRIKSIRKEVKNEYEKKGHKNKGN